MASLLNKRSWKLQDFQAHNSNVNCVALGRKSGRVMVTGGDDKKVNLWAVGKPSCFMSLSGHSTPVKCVQFNELEELVCSGSREGILKVWDLEAAKLVRTLDGHRLTIKSIDFNPYGQLLASSSVDGTIKVWDTRQRGVLNTYSGHRGPVNSVKWSPDGQWIASGGDDSTVKIWDWRVRRVVKEFNEHLQSVTSIEYHPKEFLLATAGKDCNVQLFDLENFNLVSSIRSTESDIRAVVHAIHFNPEGDCLFGAVQGYLKILGWEPSRCFDTVHVPWGRLCDISTAQNQLIGASIKLTNVQVYIVDLKKCLPMGCPAEFKEAPLPTSPLVQHPKLRKSFTKSERPVNLNKSGSLDVDVTIEECTSGTDPEEESIADITNTKDYNEIFGGRGLTRTPPPVPEPFQEPEREFTPLILNQQRYLDPTEPQILGDHNGTSDNCEALSLDNYENPKPTGFTPKYSRSKSNVDQVYQSKLSKQPDRENVPNNKIAVKPTPRYSVQRQFSVKDGGDVETKTRSENIKHSASEANLNRGGGTSRATSRKNSFSKPTRNSSVPNVSVKNNLRSLDLSKPKSKVEDLSSPTTPETDFVPTTVDRPAGIDLNEFLPKNHDFIGGRNQLPEMSETEGRGILIGGHKAMLSILKNRNKNLKIHMKLYQQNNDIKSAVESAAMLEDIGNFVDILRVINSRHSVWSLDLCVIVLPKLLDLIYSKYEEYMTLACNSLKLILRLFGDVIRTNVQSPVGSYGVDIPREERYQKAVKCHELLSQIRACAEKKASLPGKVGTTLKELKVMMAGALD
ncbi:katanin p80 WD40 repeat-containing subunit B1 [Anthonomus grandis grandis]|uniref:katanin p80 WD40 repeat-containing subunit B1 n=1 Tax=Anthonomus grandis grandis TaxID=2921223 RepID=UPI00216525D6|nr:katanin p80 WD40 repeat-containing subunit B1 [Anthonomus grandis grandis]